MPVLAGHPETAAHSTLIGCALAAVLWGFDRRFPRYFAGAGLIAIGLASVQILPTLEWLGQTGSGQFATAWPALELHQAQGLFSRDILSSPNSAGISVPEGAAYLGMLTLLAASLAPLHRARRYVAFLIGITAVAVMIAYSIEPVRWFVAHVPYMKAMKNGRFIFVASFGAAALAGLGISVLQEHETVLIGQKRKYAWFLAGTAFTVVLVSISRLQLATQVEVPFMKRPLFSAFLLSAGLVPIGWRLLGGMKERFFTAVILALVIFDLTTFSYGFVGFSRARDIYPPAPVFDFLNKNADAAHFRAVQAGNSYSVNVAMMYGFAAADGYEVLLERPRLFTSDFSQGREDGVFLVADKLVQSEDRRLDLLNVKYLVVPAGGPEFQQFSAHPDRFISAFDDGHVAVFENKRVMPRAFIVPASGIEIMPDTAPQFERLKNPAFDPRQTVLLSQPLPEAGGEDTTPPSSKNDVVIEDSDVNRYRFRIQSQGKGLLVVSQIYYPGWYATVDGERVPVVPANYALTGIPVPAGGHEVRFVFDPGSFKLGLAITIISIVFTALCWRPSSRPTASL
jgi:hypothetical protein